MEITEHHFRGVSLPKGPVRASPAARPKTYFSLDVHVYFLILLLKVGIPAPPTRACFSASAEAAFKGQQ